jgi:hypothetical protein
VSPGSRGPEAEPAITQRRWPPRISLASHEALTELSRPEKPPRPATLALSARIVEAALL